MKQELLWSNIAKTDDSMACDEQSSIMECTVRSFDFGKFEKSLASKFASLLSS